MCKPWSASVLTGQCHLPGGDDVQDGEALHLHETRLVPTGGDQVRVSLWEIGWPLSAQAACSWVRVWVGFTYMLRKNNKPHYFFFSLLKFEKLHLTNRFIWLPLSLNQDQYFSLSDFIYRHLISSSWCLHYTARIFPFLFLHNCIFDLWYLLQQSFQAPSENWFAHFLLDLKMEKREKRDTHFGMGPSSRCFLVKKTSPFSHFCFAVCQQSKKKKNREKVAAAKISYTCGCKISPIWKLISCHLYGFTWSCYELSFKKSC